MAASIRLATTADAGAILRIYTPFVTESVVSFEIQPPDLTEMETRIESTLATLPWIVCERDGVVAGYAYAAPHRRREAYQWSVESSVYVDPQQRRRGLGRALYTALFEILALQGYCNAYGGLTLPNPASEALHTACGFEPVGVYRAIGFKHAAWHDVAWYQRSLGAHPDAPDPPKPLVSILAEPALQAALRAGLHHLRN